METVALHSRLSAPEDLAPSLSGSRSSESKMLAWMTTIRSMPIASNSRRGRSFRRGVVALRHEPREVVRTEDVEMRVGRAGRQATTQWPQRPNVGWAIP